MQNLIIMDTKIFLFAAAVSVVTMSCRHTVSNDEQSVETVDVALPDVESITLSSVYPGVLTSPNYVDVVAKVNGQILTQDYNSGSYVKKGQVLFTIDPSTYRDHVQQAQAALTTAISTRDYAKTHYDAVNKALASDAVSKMEVVQAQSALEEAEASVKNAKASLATAQRLLGYCSVTAPISGQTAEGEYGIGNYVSGEGAPVKLTTIYDNSVLTAVFAIEDDRYHEIVNAIDNKDSLDFAKVPVIFEDPLPHRYFGKVSYLAPTLNNSTGTLKVKVSIDNVYNELKPGMYAKIDLPYDKISDAVMVKDSSLGSDQLGRYLYVVNDSDRVVKKHVTVGDLYHDTLRVVTKGISPAERYVTKALLKVRDGMKVNPRMIN